MSSDPSTSRPHEKARTDRPAPVALRLHRLVVTRDDDPTSPWGPEVLVPGVLEIRSTGAGPFTHLMHCPDTVALIGSLWMARPFPMTGQVLHPVVTVDNDPETVEAANASGNSVVALEVIPRDGRRHVVAQLETRVLRHQVTRLAGQVADVLAASGEHALVPLLNPALAGVPS